MFVKYLWTVSQEWLWWGTASEFFFLYLQVWLMLLEDNTHLEIGQKIRGSVFLFKYISNSHTVAINVGVKSKSAYHFLSTPVRSY